MNMIHSVDLCLILNDVVIFDCDDVTDNDKYFVSQMLIIISVYTKLQILHCSMMLIPNYLYR